MIETKPPRYLHHSMQPLWSQTSGLKTVYEFTNGYRAVVLTNTTGLIDIHYGKQVDVTGHSFADTYVSFIGNTASQTTIQLDYLAEMHMSNVYNIMELLNDS
jgi:hypothetical protein